LKRKENLFDKIGSLIPGYKGYSERDSRRNCDKIMRNTIATDLKIYEKQMNSWMLEALQAKDKVKMNDIEKTRKNMNTLISKIEYAPYGASSFFSDNKIKEDELHEIYQFDLDILECSSKVISYDKSNLDLLSNQVEKCYTILDKRNSYISQF
jgi:hypothetical protein